ncbi:19189_t:CDS:1 [Funneliformis geosporum]|uniref:19189_t:CDS:1 n=1 Tax=Funneliformis geosporum TaxID=1117311 RepID=A0A9W4SQY0_9GLOM|nr:19189_t:CDS:1 [Funneliformis geosporum]
MEILHEDHEDSLLLVNIMRIKRIINYNAFDPMDRWDFLKHILDKDTSSNQAGSGLWILPSYFNHSCIDINVDRFCLGDLMLLRTCRLILKDQELNIAYCHPVSSYEIRSKHLNKYDINCQCRLCKLDRSETQKIRLRRANILEIFEKSFFPRAKSLLNGFKPDLSLAKEMTEKVSELSELRKKHPELDLQSFEPKILLALIHAQNGNFCQSLSGMQEMYNLLKVYRLPLTAQAFQISILHFKLGQLKEAERWFDVTLKEITEPLRGKFKEDKWKKEALDLTKRIKPEIISSAINMRLI